MKCPHCLINFHEEWQGSSSFGGDPNGKDWCATFCRCPECKRIIIALRHSGTVTDPALFRVVYPKGISRAPLPPEVPEIYALDYKEACLILPDSPKASAALSRRCLQNILRNVAKVSKSDLSREIDEILTSKQLPSYLAESIDAIRNIGNFAAHPTKGTNTGAIMDVEPGEAEWTLDVLEGLFDFYFIQPAILKAKRDKLNLKLAEAGKPPMK